jgi:hypothetical protein
MTWLTSKPKSDGPPPCFGKSWEKDAVECIGGLDPTWKNEQTGSHVREPCGYFSACGSRVQAAKMEEASRLVPATSLARAWQARPGQVQSPQPMGGTSQGIQQFTMQNLQQQFEKMQKDWIAQQQQQMARGQMPMMPMMPQMMGMPQAGFQQMMPVNFEIPQYLTHREYRRPDEGLWRVLGREVGRSMLKSAGHTFANFFDSTPFYGPPPKE